MWLAISRTKESDGADVFLTATAFPGLKLSSVLSFSGAFQQLTSASSSSQNLFSENHHKTINHQSFGLGVDLSGLKTGLLGI